LRAETPAWLDELTAKSLNEDPWARWRDGGEMLVALQTGLGDAKQADKKQAEEEKARKEREAREREKRRQEEERKKREAEEKARKAKTTWTVDPLTGHGDFTTITEAIRRASPGDQILVRPGVYEEALVLDKPVELRGDGKREEIIIRAKGADVILFQADKGVVKNLTLRQIGGGNWFAVDIPQGHLHLEGCDISSQGLASVMIRDGAASTVRNNLIHDGKGHGIGVINKGAGLIEENDIFGNAYSGITIKTEAAPTVRNNRIHDGKAAGIFVYDKGAGLIEENDIFGNAYSGIAIKTEAAPTVRDNRIHDGKQNGVFVWGKGAGLIEENDIFGNAYSGIEIKTEAAPTVRNNRITRNREGIWIHKGGRGVFENNTFSKNRDGAWNIAPNCLKHITRRGNKEQ
jgi:F-box protein 11